MNRESRKYTFISHLYGPSLRKGQSSLKLGDYIVCDREYLNQNFAKQVGAFSNKFNAEKNVIALIDNYFLIRSDLDASSDEDAQELFLLEANDFVNAILYSLPIRMPENQNISVTSQRLDTELAYFVGSESHERHTSLDMINPVYILDHEMLEFEGNSEKVFSYLTKAPTTDIEKRIKSAVSWIGQGLRNPILKEGFLELSLALETLLVFDQDGFITKSITAQVSEDIAFLVEDSLEGRKRVARTIKELYGKRSAIVHPRREKTIEETDFNQLLEYLKKIVHALFQLLNKKRIASMKSLREYLDDRKFT